MTICWLNGDAQLTSNVVGYGPKRTIVAQPGTEAPEIGAATCDARCVSLPCPTAVNRLTPAERLSTPRLRAVVLGGDRLLPTDGGLFVRQRLSSEPDRYRGRRRVPTPPRGRYAVVGLSAFVGAGVVALGTASTLPDAKAVNPKILARLADASTSTAL